MSHGPFHVDSFGFFFAIANSELVNVNGTKPGGLLPVWEVLEAMTKARRDGRFCSPC